MFELTKEEYDFLRCNFFTLKNGRGQHSKYLPYAFTQEGIAMLSGLLKTPIAIQVNINIMRAFFQMQKALLTLQNSSLQIEEIRSKIKQLRIDMDETLRCQNDINEMVLKEQDKLSIQIDNINDAIAQLQAALGQPLNDVVHIFVFWGKDRRLSPQWIGQKKNAVVGFDSVFVYLDSATTIEAVMRTQERNSSEKRARSPYKI